MDQRRRIPRVFHAAISVCALAALVACGGGDSSPVATQPPPAQDTTAPSVPSGLAVTRASASTVNLTWSASTDSGGSGLAGYQVFRNNTQISSGTVGSTSFADTNANAAGLAYFVRAIDNAGNVSANSNTVTASAPPDQTAPTTPAGLSATSAGASQINLAWGSSSDSGGSGLAGYFVFRNGAQVNSTPLSGNLYGDSGLSPNTSYSYVVRAVDNAGNVSADSNAAAARTTFGGTPPTAPGSLAAVAASSTLVNLTWTAASGTGGANITGYLVFRNSVQVTASAIAALAFADSGRLPDTSYSYFVRAVDNLGNVSPNSSTASVRTAADTQAPTAPVSLTATPVNSSTIQLSWPAASDGGGSGLAGYIVLRNGAALNAAPLTATSFTDSGLSPNTAYTYLVRAVDGAGNQSGNSPTANAQTAPGSAPPAAPGTLTATINSSTQITLAWTAAVDNSGTGIAGYRIFRNGALVGTGLTSGTSFSDSGLTADTAYSYVVRATDNNGGTSSDSSAVSARTTQDTVAPAAPSGLTATSPGSQQVSLSWAVAVDTGGSGLRGYLVFRGAVQITAQPVLPTSFADAGLAPATAYQYSVRAVDNANNISAASNTASISTLPDTTPPSAPTGLGASVLGSTQIRLDWNQATDTGGAGLAGYYLIRNGLTLNSGQPITATSFVDAALAANAPYTYVVQSVDNANNHSGNSNSVTATTQPDVTPPSAPDGLGGVAVGRTQINLTWNAAFDTGGSGFAGYYVYRNNQQIAGPLSGVSYADTDLALSTSYGYYIRAVDSAGNLSANSNAINVTTLGDIVAPAAPVGLAATATGTTTISLTWLPASDDPGGSGLRGYRVYRGGVLLTPVAIVASTFTDTGLTANTTYSYTVRAEDNAGNLSGISTAANATTSADSTAPTAPAGLAATANGAFTIDLVWSGSTDETGGSGLAGYLVFRGATQLTPTAIVATNFTDIGLQPNSTYAYTVRAVDNAGNQSAMSNTASATTAAGSTLPTAPGGLAGTPAGANRIDLTWTASTDNSGTGLAGYVVYRNGTNVSGSPFTGTTYADTGLAPGTSYSYFVRATDNNGGQSSASNSVSITTAADTSTPTVPTGISATANSSTQITITWNTASDPGGTGVAGYRVYRGGSLVSGASLVTGLGFVDTALAANMSFSYTVRAVDGAGNVSGDSTAANAQTLPDTTAPTVPGGFAVSAAGSTQINLTWNSSSDSGGSGFAGYLVFRNGSQLTPTPISGSSFADTGLAPVTLYSYVVRAIDNAGNASADAGPITATTDPDTTPPPAPTGLAASATSSTAISIIWNAATDGGGSGLAGYLVFRDSVQLTGAPVTGTNYNDTGLAAATSHTYTVKAVDNAGNVSAGSATATGTTLADTDSPTAPVGLSASATQVPAIQLSWLAASDSGGSGLAQYRVYRNSVLLATVISSVTTYTDAGITFNTSYDYFVTARDGAGNESVASNTANATAVDTTAPTAPGGLSAVASGLSIGLNWNAATDSGSGVGGYRVYRDGVLLTTGALVTATAFTDSGLAANTSYSYTVRAVDRANNESGNSNSAVAMTAGTVLGLDSRPSNTSCLAPNEPTANASYAAQLVYPNRSFTEPLLALQPPGDSTRWFVVEHAGVVKSFSAADAGGSATNVFADITDRVYAIDQEMGLLGMAFHPDFANNGWVYLSYTAQPGVGSPATAESRVSRFTLLGNGNLDTSSETVLIRLPQPLFNHNGGHIAFGPDGYLYVGFGDGGGAGDTSGNSQNPNTLHGKLLRIDVSGGTSYSIPAGNVYAANPQCNNNGGSSGVGASACPEIYARGFRNPWRWSFDRASVVPKIWLGDVGQDTREEIDIVVAGGNYGWNCREGFLSYSGCLPASGEPAFIEPVIDYGRSVGASVTGGFVYRGTALPGLVGKYLFGDFYSFNLYEATANVDGSFTRTTLFSNSADFLSSFAEANNGDLYMIGFSGKLYKIVAASSTQNDTVPLNLADTGCFDAGNTQLPASGLIPYAPNAPFWSDNAVKERWMALPNNTTITVESNGDWTFPTGTVLVKHFRLNGRLFETRLFMRHADTGNWRGYTYRWNDAQSAATRVDGGLTTTVEGQTWTYPSSNECLQCHTSAAGFSLGLEIAQLNGDHAYPSTGRTANQLTTLNAIGMFASALPDAATLPQYPNPTGSGILANRARAYLHTNCAQCHRPGGPSGVNLDLRYDTAMSATATCNATPSRGDLGIGNAKLIAFGDPARSIVYQRMNRRGANQMPPIGSHVIDSTGASILSNWISAMDTSCN